MNKVVISVLFVISILFIAACGTTGEKIKNPVVVTQCGDGNCNGAETCNTCEQDCGFCDSCTDSDGGEVFDVNGSTYGYNNSQAYLFHDTCSLDGVYISERWCEGTRSRTRSIACWSVGPWNTCSGGKCINSTSNESMTHNETVFNTGGSCGDGNCDGNENCNNCQADCGHCDSCSDTDEGWEFDVFGTIQGWVDNVPFNLPDACIGADSLKEFSCTGIDRIEPNSTEVNCTLVGNYTGCEDGACIGTNQTNMTG